MDTEEVRNDLQATLMSCQTFSPKLSGFLRRYRAVRTLLLMKRDAALTDVDKYVKSLRAWIDEFDDEIRSSIQLAYSEKAGVIQEYQEELQEEINTFGLLFKESEKLLQSPETFTTAQAEHGKTLVAALKLMMKTSRMETVELNDNLSCLRFVGDLELQNLPKLGELLVSYRPSVDVMDDKKKSTDLKTTKSTPKAKRTSVSQKSKETTKKYINSPSKEMMNQLLKPNQRYIKNQLEKGGLVRSMSVDRTYKKAENNISPNKNCIRNLRHLEKSSKQQSPLKCNKNSRELEKSTKPTPPVRRCLVMGLTKEQSLRSNIGSSQLESDTTSQIKSIKINYVCNGSASLNKFSKDQNTPATDVTETIDSMVEKVNNTVRQSVDRMKDSPDKNISLLPTFDMANEKLNSTSNHHYSTKCTDESIQSIQTEPREEEVWNSEDDCELDQSQKLTKNTENIQLSPSDQMEKRQLRKPANDISFSPRTPEIGDTDKTARECLSSTDVVQSLFVGFSAQLQKSLAELSTPSKTKLSSPSRKTQSTSPPVLSDNGKVKEHAIDATESELHLKEEPIERKESEDQESPDKCTFSEKLMCTKQETQPEIKVLKDQKSPEKWTLSWCTNREECDGSSSPDQHVPSNETEITQNDAIHCVPENKSEIPPVSKTLEQSLSPDQCVPALADRIQSEGNKTVPKKDRIMCENMASVKSVTVVETRPSNQDGNCYVENKPREVNNNPALTEKSSETNNRKSHDINNNNQKKAGQKVSTVMPTSVLHEAQYMSRVYHAQDFDRSCLESAITRHIKEELNKGKRGNFLPIAAKLLFKVGEPSGRGSMKFPIGVATNSKGEIFVADTGNNVIKKFSPKGSYCYSIGSDIQMRRPSAIVVNSRDEVIVKDDYAVYVFTPNGNFLSQIGHGIFGRPFGLAATPDGLLVTLDTDRRHPRVFVFSQDGFQMNSFPFRPLLYNHSPHSKCRFIAIHAERLIVSDLGSNCIYITDNCGETLYEFGDYGVSYGKFKEPSGVTTDIHGHILIGDSKNDRIQIFKPNGSFLCDIKFDESILRPSDIHLTRDGILYVTNFLQHQVHVYKLGE